MSNSRVEDIKGLIGRERIAEEMYDRYFSLKQARRPWEDLKQEVRDYVFATDTKTTTNSKLPWKNNTTVPKLCQIRDNLHANYSAALFSNNDWLRWEAADETAISKETREGLEAYMKTKLLDSKFEGVVSTLLLDYIDYGNAFADVEWVNETYVDRDGMTQIKYQGPRLIRISPDDIVFDVTATDFERTGKFVRRVMSLGDLEKYMKEHPDAGFSTEVLNEIKDTRRALTSHSAADINKAGGYMNDGFGTLDQYYSSGYVELIEYEGDWYDVENMELNENRRITIVDRCKVLRNEPIDNYLGRSLKQHAGWRLRQDNLMAMGPLDNLVGMQYRIDHLQNLKSDVFDLTAFPPLKIRGQVEDFEWGPFERVYMDEDADVDIMSPNINALNADIEIDWTERKMEELAGAPRQALGIRTPGEKTKYEVQTLENNASRVFQEKIKHFEKHFLEPLINSMLALARDNMESMDIARSSDPTYGYQTFLKITPEMLRSKGLLRAVGARHFAERANRLQNYNNFRNSAAGQDPAVLNHISGLQESKLVQELLDLDNNKMFIENIRVNEMVKTEQLKQSAMQQLQQEAQQLTLAEEDQVDQEVANELQGQGGPLPPQ